MRREAILPADDLSTNDNLPLDHPPPSCAAESANSLRRHTAWLILVSIILAVILAVGFRVRIDPLGTFVIDWLLASLLLVSRMWWNRRGHHRVADALGAVGLAAIAGMSCGAIAMLELRFGFPLADDLLKSLDQELGVNGISIVKALERQGPWLMSIMSPAYNFTLQIFFGSLVLLSLLGDRVEVWRAAFCFVATLLATCLMAALLPAKGLGVWAPPELLAQLPPRAMRNFWPHFDEFYFGADPVLRLQVIDGVIAFPSFHSIVGFLTVAMWRKYIFALLASGTWLGFMLLSIFPGGGHYFVDLLGGFAVWWSCFAWSRRIEKRAPRAMLVSS